MLSVCSNLSRALGTYRNIDRSQDKVGIFGRRDSDPDVVLRCAFTQVRLSFFRGSKGFSPKLV